MTALPGTVDEWVEIEPSRWQRKGHPEDGVVTLREGLVFADYFARRADPPPPEPDARDEKIAALETEIAAIRDRLDKVDGGDRKVAR